jgi:HD-GYP domain-containing protein (c-di-GMP phosphodiesterase class II)
MSLSDDNPLTIMNNSAQLPRYPLHFTISALFIALVVILGVVLSWQNYSKTSDIIRSSAGKLYDQVAAELLLDIKATYRPVGDTLGLLALTPITRAVSLAERLDALGMLREVLRSGPSVTGIQVGYPDGDFFILRPLRDSATREQFAAPADSMFVADHVESDAGGQRRLTRIFFNGDLQEVARNEPEVTVYDPRLRDWYSRALASTDLVLTRPYLFYFARKIGITLARRVGETGVVVASDVTLHELSETISRYKVTAGSEIVLFTADGSAIAYPDAGKLVQASNGDEVSIARLTDLGSDVLAYLGKDLQTEPRSLVFTFDHRQWEGAIRKVTRDSVSAIYVLMASPLDELLDDAVAIRTQSLMIMVFIILITIPVVWYMAEKISGPIRRLANVAGQISRFDFSGSKQTRSFIKEVDELSQAMDMMKATINRFLTLINSLASEQDFDSLLQGISRETMAIGQADGVLVYLLSEEDGFLVPGILTDSVHGALDVDRLPELSLSTEHELVLATTKKGSSIIRLSRQSSDKLAVLPELFEEHALTLIALPLRNRQEEMIGVLSLLYRGSTATPDGKQQDDHVAFISALSGFAAVSLESRQLFMMQKELLDAFIKLIAGAIDAKSPYTGGHCQRVPELTRLLAQAACESTAAPFRDFNLDEKQWEALDIASWLHDCGKVTTPEYVVDKATKLETLNDRIHEVRTRFEVLKRDAEIRYWQQRTGGGEQGVLDEALQQELDQLDDDFAFIAECNLGGEFMAPEKIERLQRIAAYGWMRTLDDRLGVSWEERQRMERASSGPLPVSERLLDNKVQHLIERDAVDRLPADNPWGFKIDTPEYKYNRGELYNLEVSRGTLTDEERYKINDHIMQTIIMLEKLPYPKHLRDVPLIAGCHHETMDGNGYPKRLTREQMPLTARMMAVADIFEALTASDRPYKKAKKLSEAIRIMSFMKKDRHIDPDLFDLFLSSGAWLEYGRQYLQAEQIDEVDISEYLD